VKKHRAVLKQAHQIIMRVTTFTLVNNAPCYEILSLDCVANNFFSAIHTAVVNQEICE